MYKCGITGSTGILGNNLKKKIYIKKTFIKQTFLISNNKKLIKTGRKPKRDFFFEIKKFRWKM